MIIPKPKPGEIEAMIQRRNGRLLNAMNVALILRSIRTRFICLIAPRTREKPIIHRNNDAGYFRVSSSLWESVRKLNDLVADELDPRALILSCQENGIAEDD